MNRDRKIDPKLCIVARFKPNTKNGGDDRKFEGRGVTPKKLLILYANDSILASGTKLSSRHEVNYSVCVCILANRHTRCPSHSRLVKLPLFTSTCSSTSRPTAHSNTREQGELHCNVCFGQHTGDDGGDDRHGDDSAGPCSQCSDTPLDVQVISRWSPSYGRHVTRGESNRVPLFRGRRGRRGATVDAEQDFASNRKVA